MGSDQGRAAFAAQVAAGANAAAWRDAASAARAGDVAAAKTLAAALCHAAFTAPEQIAPTYDAATLGWFAAAVDAPPISAGPAAQPGEALDAQFWQVFWTLSEDSSNGAMSAGEITIRTAALAGLLSPGFQARAAAACSAYPGALEASAAGFPEKITLTQLAAAPPGSLGHDFYRLIVDNNYDIEVLDRDTLGLKTLMPPLDYLNARMLQTHDLWHIAAGYHTTKLHEVGLSAFQMAQFGHHYSSMFLALVVTTAAFFQPVGVNLLMDTILSAWRHGRQTPPMMLIPWEEAWLAPVDEVRARYGISEYPSPYPANIVEMLEASAAA